MTQSRSMELLKAFLMENPEQVQNLGKAELTHNMKLLRAFLMENPEQVQNLGKNENK